MVDEKIQTDDRDKDWEQDDYGELDVTLLTEEQQDLIIRKEIFVKGNKLLNNTININQNIHIFLLIG